MKPKIREYTIKSSQNLLCIITILFGIFQGLIHFSYSQSLCSETLLNDRIEVYYHYFKNGEWDKTWRFLSINLKNHLASLPEAPNAGEPMLREVYVKYMDNFFGKEEMRNMHYAIFQITIDEFGNKAYVKLQGKYMKEDIEINNVWICENSNWFLEEY